MMKKMLFFVSTLVLISTVLAACSGDVVSEAVCGDGICSEGESEESCAVDCAVEVEDLPTETPAPTPTEEIDPIGYVTFAVYVSDFVHHDQSAETVLALIDLFEANGLHAEFYLTGPMTHIYAEAHGEVIDRLRETDMTISYHSKPPHPQTPGFLGPISGLPVDQTGRMITRYETERLDLETGGLIAEQPGGFNYLKDLFGTPPLAIDAPKSHRSGFALPMLAEMGARVVVFPSEYDPQQPFKRLNTMLLRPADITINRWQVDGVEGAQPWWEMQESEFQSSFSPRDRLQQQAEAWDAERLPFILVPINEYSFYRSGPAPWTLIYYQDETRSAAKSPPFDLNAPDASSERSEDAQQRIWDAYSQMVEWGSVYLEVVTSEDILLIAQGLE
ncbi:MAG: hypothetical protein PVF18_10270 [Anaerolineales bacterium]|jgi:hypothetical protein